MANKTTGALNEALRDLGVLMLRCMVLNALIRTGSGSIDHAEEFTMNMGTASIKAHRILNRISRSEDTTRRQILKGKAARVYKHEINIADLHLDFFMTPATNEYQPKPPNTEMYEDGTNDKGPQH